MADYKIEGDIKVGAEAKQGQPGIVEVKLPPIAFVYRADSYSDQDGRSVQERVCVGGEFPPGYWRFVGVGKINLELPNSQKLERSFNFPIKGATTLQEAFSRYEAEMHAHAKQATNKILEQLGLGGEKKIQIAGASDVPPTPMTKKG